MTTNAMKMKESRTNRRLGSRLICGKFRNFMMLNTVLMSIKILFTIFFPVFRSLIVKMRLKSGFYFLINLELTILYSFIFFEFDLSIKILIKLIKIERNSF